MKPNFTLELGVRWDVAGALGETTIMGANFLPGDPKADSGGFVSLADQSTLQPGQEQLRPEGRVCLGRIRQGQDGAARRLFFGLRPAKLWRHPCSPNLLSDVERNPGRVLHPGAGGHLRDRHHHDAGGQPGIFRRQSPTRFVRISFAWRRA